MKVSYETLTLGLSSNNPPTKDGKYGNANWLIIEHLCLSIVAFIVWRWWVNPYKLWGTLWSLNTSVITAKAGKNYKKTCEASHGPDRLHMEGRCLYKSNRKAAQRTIFENEIMNIKVIIILKHYWQALYHWATALAVTASIIKNLR